MDKTDNKSTVFYMNLDCQGIYRTWANSRYDQSIITPLYMYTADSCLQLYIIG